MRSRHRTTAHLCKVVGGQITRVGGHTTRVGIGAFEGSLFSAKAFLLLCVAAAMMQIDCRKWNVFNGYQHVRTETGSNQGQNMALTALCVPSSLENGLQMAFEGSLVSAKAFLLLCVAAAMMRIDCSKTETLY